MYGLDHTFVLVSAHLLCMFLQRIQPLSVCTAVFRNLGQILHFLAVFSNVVRARSWSLWFGCLRTTIMLSAITMTFYKCPKHWSSFLWNTLPATVAPNGMTVYQNLMNSVLNVVK